MKFVYELKQFRSSSSRDIAQALSIYSRNIEATLKTDTREILHWLDEYSKCFLDKFIALGFYKDAQIIGYAQVANFVEERIIFVDYIAIDKEYRGNNTFYEFIEQIRYFFTDENIEFDYIIAEVGGFDGLEPSTSTKNLIRLLKMTGFGVVKTTYYHPGFGKHIHNNQFQSVLMLYTEPGIKYIIKETFLMLLETIYFKHYQRWYKVFLSEKEFKEYSTGLKELFNKSQNILKKSRLLK